MDLLLDTHTFLWAACADPKMSLRARAALDDPENNLFLSVASLWEMAIKVSAGKLDIEAPFDLFVLEQTVINNISILSIMIPHLQRLVSLPQHHRDPFDRLIIAQAMADHFTLVSADKVFDAYRVDRIW